MFMDKHVLSCEQVCTGSQIIIQELFDERGTEQGEKGDNLDHIINFTTRCTPLCDRHIPTTQEMPKQTPHFIFLGTENIPFLWLLMRPFIGAMHSTVFLLQCSHLDGCFLTAINFTWNFA